MNAGERRLLRLLFTFTYCLSPTARGSFSNAYASGFHKGFNRRVRRCGHQSSRDLQGFASLLPEMLGARLPGSGRNFRRFVPKQVNIVLRRECVTCALDSLDPYGTARTGIFLRLIVQRVRRCSHGDSLGPQPMSLLDHRFPSSRAADSLGPRERE